MRTWQLKNQHKFLLLATVCQQINVGALGDAVDSPSWEEEEKGSIGVIPSSESNLQLSCQDQLAELDDGDQGCDVISNGTLAECLARCNGLTECDGGEDAPAPKAIRCYDSQEAENAHLLCCCRLCERRQTRIKWRQGPIGARDKVSRKGHRKEKRHGKGGVVAKKGRNKKQGNKIKRLGSQNRMKKKDKKGKGKKAAGRSKSKKHKNGHKKGGNVGGKDNQGVNKKDSHDGSIQNGSKAALTKPAVGGGSIEATGNNEGLLVEEKKGLTSRKADNDDKTDDDEEDGEEEGGDDSGGDCSSNILAKYPQAECGKTRDKDECRVRCEQKGNEKCAGRQGEIHKLNCKGEEPDADGQITCCCSIKCEAKLKTRARLNAEFESKVGDTTGLCVDVDRDQVKAKLNEICKTKDEVFVARKYCLEQLKGAYFCVKNGHCFGTQCKGCVKHECELGGGNKTVFTPPPQYMKEHLRLKDFDKSVAVNVDDMKDTRKMRQWCTMLEDRSTCADTCRNFGDKMCGMGNAIKYDHDDVCRRGQKQCKCCCKPVCKADNKAASDSTSNTTTKAPLKQRKIQLGIIDGEGEASEETDNGDEFESDEDDEDDEDAESDEGDSEDEDETLEAEGDDYDDYDDDDDDDEDDFALEPDRVVADPNQLSLT